jgi:hypothetical protein
MRVSRALEKLRDRLRKRGLVVTASGMTAAFAEHAGAAVPKELAAQITASALKAGLAGATVPSGILMSAAKIKMGVAVAAAVVAGVTALHQYNRAREANARLTASVARVSALEADVRSWQTRAAEEAERAAAADRDTAQLVGAVQQTIDDPSAPVPKPILESGVEARFSRARQLAAQGQWEEALREYLWCYDEGMVRVASMAGVRTSFLMSAMAELATKYPPARAALVERRDRLERRMLRNPTDREAALDAAALNGALDEQDRNMVIFEQLPANDARREGLLLRIYDDLIAERRYREAASARSYATMVSHFELLTSERAMPNAEAVRVMHRGAVISTAAKDVEVLAGAGNLTEAREFARRLLAFDDSAETRRLVQEHALRAGAKDLVE